jgi:hypothetical protein
MMLGKSSANKSRPPSRREVVSARFIPPCLALDPHAVWAQAFSGSGSATASPAWIVHAVLECLQLLPTGMTPAILAAQVQEAWESTQSRTAYTLDGVHGDSARITLPEEVVNGRHAGAHFAPCTPTPCVCVADVVVGRNLAIHAITPFACHMPRVRWTGVSGEAVAHPMYMVLQDADGCSTNALDEGPCLYAFVHPTHAFLMHAPFRDLLAGCRVSLVHALVSELWLPAAAKRAPLPPGMLALPRGGCYMRLLLPCANVLFWVVDESDGGSRPTKAREVEEFVRDCFPALLADVPVLGYAHPPAYPPSFVVTLLPSAAPVAAKAGEPNVMEVSVQDAAGTRGILRAYDESASLLRLLQSGHRLGVWRPYLPPRSGPGDAQVMELSSCTILFVLGVPPVAPFVTGSSSVVTARARRGSTSPDGHERTPSCTLVTGRDLASIGDERSVSMFARVAAITRLGSMLSLRLHVAGAPDAHLALTMPPKALLGVEPGHLLYLHDMLVCRAVPGSANVTHILRVREGSSQWNVSCLQGLLESPFLCVWTPLDELAVCCVDVVFVEACIVDVQHVSLRHQRRCHCPCFDERNPSLMTTCSTQTKNAEGS